jgi:hypothetical protein
MPDDDHPGAAYPPECRRLMDLTLQRVVDGDIAGAMRMQARTNDCLRRHGYPAHDMPEEYYRLMHQSIAAHRRGDRTESERLRQRMEEVEAMQDVEGRENMPEECKALLRAQQAAEDRGDWRAAILLTKDYTRCLEAHGMLETHMPDEFFDLQLAAQAALQRGDRATYQRCLAECQLLLQAHGLTPDDTGGGGPVA